MPSSSSTFDGQNDCAFCRRVIEALYEVFAHYGVYHAVHYDVVDGAARTRVIRHVVRHFGGRFAGYFGRRFRRSRKVHRADCDACEADDKDEAKK